MDWQNWQQKLASIHATGYQLDSSRPVVVVDSNSQRLSCFSSDGEMLQQYPVSTSRYGMGQQQGSHQTPYGLHCIAQKIGDGEPCGRVFRARQASDEICLPDAFKSDEDVITTRILWLQGLEPGFNRGGEVDSFERFIYIHGTSDEAHIGEPASIGCIRMKNPDVIDLFDLLHVNDLVIIE
jgi:hypothetical protein